MQKKNRKPKEVKKLRKEAKAVFKQEEFLWGVLSLVRPFQTNRPSFGSFKTFKHFIRAACYSFAICLSEIFCISFWTLDFFLQLPSWATRGCCSKNKHQQPWLLSKGRKLSLCKTERQQNCFHIKYYYNLSLLNHMGGNYIILF